MQFSTVSLSKRSLKMKEAFIIFSVRALVHVFDVLTLPIYFLIQRPWKHWTFCRAQHSYSVSGLPEGPYRGKIEQTEFDYLVENVYTINDLFMSAVKRGGNAPMLGTRMVIDVTEHEHNGKKAVLKFNQGDYKWTSFVQANEDISIFAKALLHLGLGNVGSKLCVMAETKQEWLLLALAAFRVNVTIVTLYSNLGIEGILSGLNESEAEVLVIDHDMVEVIFTNLPRLPRLKKLIYFESKSNRNISSLSGAKAVNVELISFFEFKLMGVKSTKEMSASSSADSIAIIMYTSGSSGKPKGVELSHKNIMAVISGFLVVVNKDLIGGTYVAYLPLAHIFEIIMELIALSLGMRIGYSSPATLTDRSPGVMDGQRGDIALLKPKLLAVVPLILDRLRKEVLKNVRSKSPIMESLVKLAIRYKSFWMRHGFQVSLLDYILFDKTRQILGGNLQTVIVGSAHLSEETHAFARACLCKNTLFGLGLTECAAAITVQLPGIPSLSTCGYPMRGMQILLQAWPVGGYYPSNKPRPQGEILIAGENITKGYFKNPQITQEAFTEIDGVMYFKTGDIGEITETGELVLIDRRKDLFKGASGEYVALGHVEAELKSCPLVENICVWGHGETGRLIALIVVNPAELRKLIGSIYNPEDPLEQICEDPIVKEKVHKMIFLYGKSKNMLDRELPSAVILLSEPWTPSSGLVTAALKIRKKPIEEFYKRVLQEEITKLLKDA